MNFKTTYLPLGETKSFSKTLVDYVQGASYLAPFYEYKPVIAEFKKAIEGRGKLQINRQLLVSTLQERYKKNAPAASELTCKNIEMLSAENCFTVTTGHQLCLFTGPLFFIYKIITAINLAKELNKEYPNGHFVPVYWMATEDHDFAEINHTYIFGKKLEWTTQEFTGGPVGNMPTSSIKPVLDELLTIMGEAGNNSGLHELFTKAYLEHATLSEAVFYLVDRLFSKYGLVIVDANDARLKKEFLPVISNELLNQSSSKLVDETNKNLRSAGVEPQVYHRELNLFYIDKNGRNRIERQENNYLIHNTATSFTKEQIIVEANESPEKFSPNVVLRPLYQQIILPNVAYVGGPSEIAYWFQLKGIFNHYSAAFPMLIPRSFAMLIDKQTAGKRKKLNIKVNDLFRDTEDIVKDFVMQNSPVSTGFEEEKEKLRAIYDAIIEKTKLTDPTLTSLPEAELQKQFNALKGLETKLLRARKQKLETSVNQIRKLKERLFPGGELQERHDNFIPFYLANGDSFFDMLAENFKPLDFRFTVLEEEENS